MCIRYLGFVLLIWFPGALHAQSATQSCSAPTLDGGFFAPKQETYSHGTELTYTCNDGRKPSVEGWWVTSTCLNGTWSHEPQCIDEKACMPPTILNSLYTVNTNGWYEERDIIRIKCNEGYEHKDWDATAECVNGTWTSVPICETQNATQSCSAPRLDGGFFAPKQETYSHGTELTYTCNVGRKPAVEGWWPTTTCLNGTWSHEPQCIDEKACMPPTIPNGIYTVNTNGWYEERHIIRIKCNEGYEHKDSDATAECVNGTWSSVPICEKSIHACGELPKVPHAIIIHQKYQEVFPAGTAVQYECEDGYTVEGADTKKSIYCIAGNWTEGPKCRSSTSSGSNERIHFTTIAQCGAYPIVPNGVVVKEEPMFLKYQCNPFYTQVGKDTVGCLSNGSWSQLPICDERFCVLSPPITNLKLSGAVYIKEGDVQFIPCIWNYFFSRVQCINGRLSFSQCCEQYYHDHGRCR